MGLWNLMFSSYRALKGWSQIFIFYRTNILSKIFIPYCSNDWPKTFPHSYALLPYLVFYKNGFL